MDALNALVVLANFVLIPAFSYGSLLALGALGVTLVYAVLRFANFAHGDTMSVATMIAIFCTQWFQSTGISIFPLPTALLALPIACLVTVMLLLWVDRGIYQHFRRVHAPLLTMVIVSIAIMFVLRGLSRMIIGVGEQRFFDGARFVISAGEFKALTGLTEGLALKSTQLIAIIAAVVLMLFLFWFLKKTRMGKAMRAFADNEELALLSGINPRQIVTVCWIMVAILAATSGTLYGLDKVYKPFIYFHLLLPIFAAAVVGGMGNPVGAVFGGYLIAFSEIGLTYAFKRVAGHLLPETWLPTGLLQLISTDYKFAVSFSILVAVLLFRPTGLFRGQTS